MFLGLASALAGAIPDDVTVVVFAKPAGLRLQLLVRIPMAVFGDIHFPLRAENYLDVPQAEAMLPAVAKYQIAPYIEIYDNGKPLPKAEAVETRLAIESDPSFASYEQALAHLLGPRLEPATSIFWRQSWLDILFEIPAATERPDWGIRFNLAHLGTRVHTDLRFLFPGGGIRPFTYEGDPGLVRLDPSVPQTAIEFVRWGFLHVLDGADYLLFVFCIALPVRQLGRVAAMFVCASAATLLASAYGLASDSLWFKPLVDTAMAAGIFYLALANIGGWIAPERRPAIAMGFGLVYGFGFWFGLSSKMQFGGAHPAVSAIAFSTGIELAVIGAFGLAGILTHLISRVAQPASLEAFVPSVLAAHTGWHWMADRWDRLRVFPLHWPVLDMAYLAAALRWLAILAMLVGGLRFVSGWVRSRTERKRTV